MRTVAVLCATSDSSYSGLDGVEIYDKRRDARTFNGAMPIIAHPPCRAWSLYCSHQAKPEPGEKELGIFCAEQLKEHGGVLEQPARSRLFEAAGLPLPNNKSADGMWSVEVYQSWWGHKLIKRTWLCFSGISKSDICVPLSLTLPTGNKLRFKTMTAKERSHTPLAFAKWLVEAARNSHKNEPAAFTHEHAELIHKFGCSDITPAQLERLAELDSLAGRAAGAGVGLLTVDGRAPEGANDSSSETGSP